MLVLIKSLLIYLKYDTVICCLSLQIFILTESDLVLDEQTFNGRLSNLVLYSLLEAFTEGSSPFPSGGTCLMFKVLHFFYFVTLRVLPL